METTLRKPGFPVDRLSPWILGSLPVAMILFDGALAMDQNASLWFMPIPVICALVAVLVMGLATKAVSAGLSTFSTRPTRLSGLLALGLWGLAFGLTALQAVNPTYGFLKLSELALFAGLALTLTGFLLRNGEELGVTLVLAFVAGIAVSVPLSALARSAGWPAGYGLLDMPGFIHIRIYGFSLAMAFAACVGLWQGVPRRMQAGLFVAMVLCATALFWSGGRAALLALCLGLPGLALFLPRLRWALIPAALALALGAVAATAFVTTGAEFGMADRLAEAAEGGSADALTSGRLGMWSTLIDALRQNPLAGVGYAQSHWIFSGAGLEVAHLHAHSVILDVGLGLGLPALLVAVALVFYALVHAIMLARHADSALPTTGVALVTVFLIVSLVDGAYFYHQGLLPLTLGAALLLGSRRVQDRSKRTPAKRS